MLKLITFDELDLLIGLSVLVCLLPIVWRQKRSVPYLLFFSIFWVYLLAVVQAVVFPILINLESSNTTFTPNINLIPFAFGNCSMLYLCVRSIIENILLTVPFGFGINFLLPIKPRSIFWLAVVTGLMFELSQLIISLVFRSGFRVVDINDVIFNSIGVLIGYVIFRLFAWVYLKIAEYFDFKHKWLFVDIYNVAFRAQVNSKSKRPST
jgi:glycopeptide antibiotics resistance protein